MKRFALLTCVLIFGVFASTMSSADIYRDCEAAVERGENVNVQRLAATIMRFNSIPADKQTAANICVSVSMGQEMAYNSGEFIPLAEFEEIKSQAMAARAAQEEVEKAAAEAVRVRICELRDIVAETNKTLQEAEAAQQDRRIETLAATIQECSIWFEDDARGALTNDVCNSIFASGGLPNSEVSGPTTSEVLLAEIINKNAETELRILVEGGMLLSTIAAKALEMGLLEGDDPYDCRE